MFISVHLLARRAKDVVFRRMKSVDHRIATPRGDGPLGYAYSIGIVDITSHRRHARNRVLAIAQMRPLRIIEVLVDAIAQNVARLIVSVPCRATFATKVT